MSKDEFQSLLLKQGYATGFDNGVPVVFVADAEEVHPTFDKLTELAKANDFVGSMGVKRKKESA